MSPDGVGASSQPIRPSTAHSAPYQRNSRRPGRITATASVSVADSPNSTTWMARWISTRSAGPVALTSGASINRTTIATRLSARP